MQGNELLATRFRRAEPRFCLVFTHSRFRHIFALQRWPDLPQSNLDRRAFRAFHLRLRGFLRLEVLF